MDNTYTIGTRMIPINNSFLILTLKSGDYIWTEISFRKGNKETYIGSYSLDCNGKHESLIYNKEYVFVLNDPLEYDTKKVKLVFNMTTGEKVIGTDEELYRLYEEVFINKTRTLRR